MCYNNWLELLLDKKFVEARDKRKPLSGKEGGGIKQIKNDLEGKEQK